MTEYDNDPQRQPVAPDERSGHAPTAEPSDAARPSTGTAEPATVHLPAGQPPAGAQPAAGQSAPGAQSAGTQSAGAPSAGASGPALGDAATQQFPTSVPPSPVPPTSVPPTPVPSGSQPTGVATGGYPGGQGHPVNPGAGVQPAPSYPGSEAGPYPGAPGGSGAPYPGSPAAPGGQYPGSPGGPGALGAPGGPYPGSPVPPPGDGPGQPPWAQPVAGHHQPRQPGRFGRTITMITAAVLLSVSSGLLGGFIATQLDDDSAPAATSGNRTTAAAPVIQRDSLATIADKVQPSVVSISAGSSEGSGVVITEDGYVLTNNHVVANAQGNQVSVVFADGKTAKAKIVGTDARTDLAVVKAEEVSGLVPATFGDSSAMQVGDTVLALGSPLGLQGSVTAGIVSALDRTIQVGGERQQNPGLPGLPQQEQQRSSGVQSMAGLLQTDAPINPGNSGGALVNLSGEVIGINTAIATSGQGEGNIGVGFAIPSNKAKQVSEQLKSGGKVSHPFLGVSVTDAEGGNGALVGTVQPGSPAAEVGMQKGDVVTQLGDKKINNSEDLVSAVQGSKVDDRLEVTYIRNGEQKKATVKLAEAS